MSVFTAQQKTFLRELNARREWREILAVLERDAPAIRSWKHHQDNAGESYAYQSGERDRHHRILRLLRAEE